MYYKGVVIIKRVNHILDKHFINIIIVFLLMQPVIDIITSITVRFFDSSITVGVFVRILMLIIVLYSSLFIVKWEYKKYLIMFIAAIGIYAVIYTMNVVMSKDVSLLFVELKSLIKLIYFPIMLVSLLCVFQAKDTFIETKQIVIPGITYSVLILLALITNTAFFSYENGKAGSVGWFYASNEIGAILAIILPVLVFFLIKNHKRIIYYIFLAVYIVVCLLIGTKAPMIGVFITLGMVALVYLVKLIAQKNKIKSIIVIFSAIFLGALLIVMLPNTPCGKNLGYHLASTNVHSVADFFDSDVEPVKDNDNQNADDLDLSENTIDNSTNVIYSSRNIFLKRVMDDSKDDSLFTKLFGKGYISGYNTSHQMSVSVEMDFYDIFFRLGIIGFIIYFAPLALLLGVIAFGFFKRFGKNLCNDEVMGYVTGLALALGLGYIAGHVLTAPSVSIYVALIIIGLYRSLRESKDEKRENTGD